MALDPMEFGILSATESYRQARAMFSEQTTVAAHLRFEAALARAEARAGVIPQDAAERIEAACRLDLIDLDLLRKEAGIVGYPIVPLVRQLARLSGEAGGWVHWGATTQDVMDSGLMLQARDGLDLVLERLESVCANLRDLVLRHRDTVMVGRSKIQHAAPITFGYKAAVWLSQIERSRDKLAHLRRHGLMLQFGGAVGTLAALGESGLKVRSLLAEELGLTEPPITWHVARDALSDLVYALAMVNGSLAKMGIDVALMMATETDEVREPFVPGRGTSSTMPQKRNPVLSEALISSAKASREGVSLMLDAMVQDHERASMIAHLELRAVAQGVMLAAGAADIAAMLTGGLEVNVEKMRTNFDVTKGLVMAEAAMMGLAREVGRDKAHELVHHACHEASRNNAPLPETLAKTLAECPGIPAASLRDVWQPESYLGVGRQMADRVLDRQK
ncbi:adenylosuccinate lyase family protein [Telmatospirillum sp. J64-1]|uniref:class-II fumarase/aspartase family protein n=1 Tax=Telmatospirillum sp. J64-1 TaxID=2502183 RepID=UPI00115D3A9A|nr:adenylosuccinate lyase family protein [Telmatospirillum sp. J64-1]